MKVSRQDAIRALAKAADHRGSGFDNWWPDMMDDLGLYDEENDKFPSIFDLFEALGVSNDECKELGL